jgi:hypothetical protein
LLQSVLAFASKGKKYLLQTFQELASMKEKNIIEEQKLLQSLRRFAQKGKKIISPNALLQSPKVAGPQATAGSFSYHGRQLRRQPLVGPPAAEVKLDGRTCGGGAWQWRWMAATQVRSC